MIDLAHTARRMVRDGKGILAIDETPKSADKRLVAYGMEATPEMRHAFRDLFLDTPGIEKYLTGAILQEETLSQTAGSGAQFPELLASRGMIAGIKVDEGLEPFPDSPDETITNGLIGLPQRLARYRLEHATGFTKWRAAIRIDGTRLPTSQAIYENARRLAQYAKEVQLAGMVPMVEPEVLLEGAHSRIRSREVLSQTLSALMRALEDQAVEMEAVILKTAMAISGSGNGRTDSPEEVAAETVAVLLETVPKNIPGIVFLSGGQTTEQATENLHAIRAEAASKNAPWPLTFSYARALQDEALAIWQGKPENVPAAREAFIARLQKVSGIA